MGKKLQAGRFRFSKSILSSFVFHFQIILKDNYWDKNDANLGKGDVGAKVAVTGVKLEQMIVLF